MDKIQKLKQEKQYEQYVKEKTPHAKKKRSNMFAVFGKEKRTIRLIMREKRVTEDPYLRLR